MSSSQTMSGLVVSDFGAISDVVKISEDLIIPEINDDEILVKVYYGSVHMGDWKLIRGDMGAMAGFMGFKPPFFPGQDYSGKVVKIGKNVENFKPGDLVYGEVRLGHGTLCQYIIVTEKEKEIYKIPNDKPFSLLQAAAMQCTLETTYQALVVDAKFEQGESILILGGSSMAGMYAIQIAKNCFNSPNITCTSSREELCKSLGAHRVINYKKDQWEKVLKDANFDVIFDVVGGKKSWNDCCSNNVLKSTGKYVTICGDFEGDQGLSCCIVCGVMCGVLNRKLCGCGKPNYYFINQQRSETIEDAVKLVIDKKIKIMIDEESPFDLNDFEKCFQKSMNKGAHGKLLIKLWDEDYDEEQQQNVDVDVDDDEKYDAN